MTVLLGIFIFGCFAAIFVGTGVVMAMSAFDDDFSRDGWGERAVARSDDRDPAPVDNRYDELPL